LIDLSNALLSGVIIGSLYAAMALGLALIYGVVRIFNFAHGSMSVLAGHLTLLFLKHTGVGLAPAISISVVIMFLMGLALYKTTLSFLVKKPNWEFSTIVFLLGLAILMQNLILLFFGPRIKAVPKFFAGGIELGFLRINWHDLGLLVFVIVFFIGLNLFLRRTWIGKAMRAVAQEITGAMVVGINTDRIYSFAFALATAVTGLSGILLATRYFVAPHAGWTWMFRGFIIVVFGSLGSVTGAIYAAFILGITEALISLYLGELWVWPCWFIIFVGVMVLRPQGLFSDQTI